MKVAVIAEYYPRAGDPVLGIWAHRQAIAAQQAGAEVRVLVLHRPIPPLAAVKRLDRQALITAMRQPRRDTLDGIEIQYVPFIAPPRPLSYGSWGAWSAPPLSIALRNLRRSFQYDLIHAHYAIPAGDAVRRAGFTTPLVISVHGGDVLYTARRSERWRRTVQKSFVRAQLVMANSQATAERCKHYGAAHTRVVHLGTDLPLTPSKPGLPTLVTVGHLIARKRHGDVIQALAILRDRHPQLRYVIIGDGPERRSLEQKAHELGLANRVEFHGQLNQKRALQEARRCSLFVLPSIDEAFGVAYIEAMAAGLPVIGCRGEGGPEEIAICGDGIQLVEPGNINDLAERIDALMSNSELRTELGKRGRATVEQHFTWEQCGHETIEAYKSAISQ